jgi:hypothetical protein
MMLKLVYSAVDDPECLVRESHLTASLENANMDMTRLVQLKDDTLSFFAYSNNQNPSVAHREKDLEESRFLSLSLYLGNDLANFSVGEQVASIFFGQMLVKNCFYNCL